MNWLRIYSQTVVIMTLTMINLKLFGWMDVSWWRVLSPILFTLALIVLVVLIAAICLLVFITRKREEYERKKS